MNEISQKDQAILARIGVNEVEKRDRRRQKRDFGVALLFMSPALLMVCGLLLAPVFYNVYLSFTNWRKFTGLDELIGFANYERMLGNPFFGEALTNTAIWVVASIVFPIAVGLGLALFLRDVRFSNTFKNIIFIPRILAPTAVGVLWFYVYAPQGLLNRGLSAVSGQQVDIGWLYQDNTVTPAIIATFVWQTVGLVMVLILLGLAAIPKDPVEAAQIDGASRFQTFRHVVLPLLTPTLLVVTILSVLAGFTVFDLLWVMGASYPGQRSLSLAVYMYFEAFQKGSWAYGSAVAVIIGLVVLSVTWVQAALQQRVDRMVR
ncbi:ABC-type sugar transport system permease subunit [Devosia subaequoris]|uniref:ABC-type sugar transport system permease subunit n=1 Tax=Devosia subaequoris TaxID=395930 RepID=A0A7W6IQJ0_9HYPH|nr:ABC-type sugar transport system permease subunit [Devosia subaequoris]MCP1211519.1 sugar ABC transporter permease [Devosia subaequoris]